MTCLVLVFAALVAVSVDRYQDADGKTRVALVKMPYRGERNLPELSEVPDYLEQGGIVDRLAEKGARCSSLMSMLAGLQRSGPGGKPLRVGLVFIDAHGDFNTPETTLNSMLGGMPVAISAGLCLTNLRLKSGLEPALPTRYIVLAGVRDTDPLEQELIDRSEMETLSVEDLRGRSARLHEQMERLSRITGRNYVHVDMDVLDPKEVSGHPLTVPDGPASQDLAAAITEMFRYDKTAAFGVASTPAGERDPGGLSRRAAYNLILGALAGVQQRAARHVRAGISQVLRAGMRRIELRTARLQLLALAPEDLAPTHALWNDPTSAATSGMIHRSRSRQAAAAFERSRIAPRSVIR
jgi:hypothetical protein